VAGRLRDVPVFFRCTTILHERDTVPESGRLGRRAPHTRLKPHNFNLFRSGLVDVSRHRLRPPEDHGQINGTRDVG
jgi:hypothetical protein